MKITKYFFLLILILTVTSIIFIATQPGTFKIKGEEQIDLNSDKVYNYVNQAETWKDWLAMPNAKNALVGKQLLILDGKTSNNKFRWKNEDKNKSITQDYFLNGVAFNSKWKFISLKNKTIISWEISGELDFFLKFKVLIEGGKQRMFKNQIISSLKNIKRNILNDFFYFEITFDGKQKLSCPSVLYKDSITSYTNLDTAKEQLQKDINSIVKQFDLTKDGDYFFYIQNSSKSTKIRAYLPIKEEVLTNDNSAIKASKIEEIDVFKTVYKGNKGFETRAIKETKKQIDTLKLLLELENGYFEKTIIGKEKTLKRKDWTTEIYIPLKKKRIYVVPSYNSTIPEPEQTVIPAVEIAPIVTPKPTVPEVSIQ